MLRLAVGAIIYLWEDTFAVSCFEFWYETPTAWLTPLLRFSIQPLTILGVTGPFTVLAENIHSLCSESFSVSRLLRSICLVKR